MKDAMQTPCPFCKSLDLTDCYVCVKCNHCGATGPKTNGGRHDDHADWVDHERALKKWSIRFNV